MTSSTSSGTPATAADTGSSTSTSGSSSSSSSSASSGSTSSGSSGSTSSTGSSTGNSSVTLGWTAPTQNSNGTAITNLAGYKIHYGTASQDYTQVVALNNPSLSRYVIDSLPSGTYYFAITSYNAQGVESSLSGEVSATLND